MLVILQGFLTDSGDVNLDRVQLIMADLGQMEDEIFKKRQQTEEMFKQRNKMKKMREKVLKARQSGPTWLPQGQFAPRVSPFFSLLRNWSEVILENV